MISIHLSNTNDQNRAIVSQFRVPLAILCIHIVAIILTAVCGTL